MALQPFTWGRGGEKLSPNQVKRYQDIAAALAADNQAATTFGGGLAKIGDALLHNSYNARAAEGEKAGAASRQAVVDALMANPDPGMSDLIGAMSNPWVQDDAGTSAIVQALMGQEIQQNDPMYQAELEALRNPTPEYDYVFAPNGDLIRTGGGGVESMGNYAEPVAPGFDTVTLQLPDGTQRTFNTAIPEQAAEANALLGQGAIEATSPLVEIGAGEREYDKTVGAGYGQDFLDIQDAEDSARSALNSLEVMEQAMSQPGFYSGAGAEQVAQLKRWGQVLGLDAEGIDSIEAFNAQAKSAALDAMGGSLGTGFSNADRDFVLDQVPQLANSPQGNAALIRVQKAINRRKIEIAQMARDYDREHGQLDSGFYDELSRWAETNPLFPEGTIFPESATQTTPDRSQSTSGGTTGSGVQWRIID